MAKIKFNFEDKSIESKTIEETLEGSSILDVTEKGDIHLNHNCGGVCACSTCHIYVHIGDEFLAEMDDDEEDFVDRADSPTLESRLACQCLILDDEAVIEVTIPDQGRIIGHEH